MAAVKTLYSRYQNRQYRFSRALTGYSSSGYPLGTIHWFAEQHGRARVITFQRSFDKVKLVFFVAGYSLVWCILKQVFTSVEVKDCSIYLIVYLLIYLSHFVCMYVWMDVCMYGWMDGWMDVC